MLLKESFSYVLFTISAATASVALVASMVSNKPGCSIARYHEQDACGSGGIELVSFFFAQSTPIVPDLNNELKIPHQKSTHFLWPQ